LPRAGIRTDMLASLYFCVSVSLSLCARACACVRVCVLTVEMNLHEIMLLSASASEPKKCTVNSNLCFCTVSGSVGILAAEFTKNI
jgi:hypothetical protein